MFEKFTEPARQVVVEAQAIAQRCQHTEVTERHLLVGLASAARPSIASLAIEELDTRRDIGSAYIAEAGYPVDDRAGRGQTPFSPTVKQVLEFSLREALSLGHNYIAPEHLLLALGRVEGGLGPLPSPDLVREAVVRLLCGDPRTRGAQAERQRRERLRAQATAEVAIVLARVHDGSFDDEALAAIAAELAAAVADRLGV